MVIVAANDAFRASPSSPSLLVVPSRLSLPFLLVVDEEDRLLSAKKENGVELLLRSAAEELALRALLFRRSTTAAE